MMGTPLEKRPGYQWLKKCITGTPLEFQARNLHARIFRDKYDKQTISVMKRVLKRNSNCVDVGCHRGIILREITRIAPEGCHYAFEPIPELYKYLKKHFPDVAVFNYALCDTEGEKTFQYIVNSPPLSGFKRIIQNEPTEEIRVEANLLDNVVPESIPIHFIKIDVEGAEFKVLEGSNRTIANHRPIIVFEHNLNALLHYDTKPEDLYGFLSNKCGMRISLMERWLSGDAPLRLEEFSEQIHNWTHGYYIAYPQGF